MAKWKRDVLYGIAIIAAAVIASISSMNMHVEGLITAARPDVYLWVWMTILTILALALIIKAVHKKDETKLEAIWCQEGVVTVVLTFLYLLIMPLIGFTISSIVFEVALLFYYAFRMGKLKGEKKHIVRKAIVLVIVAVVATIATEAIFTSVLSVRLPAGKLF